MRAQILAGASALALLAGPAAAAVLSATPVTAPGVLAHALAGDIVQLAPGTYSGLSFYHHDYGAGITVTSADPAHPAVLTNFNIEAVQGLTFRRLDMQVLLPNYNAFNIYGGQHVTFDQVHVYGPPGAARPGRPGGELLRQLRRRLHQQRDRAGQPWPQRRAQRQRHGHRQPHPPRELRHPGLRAGRQRRDPRQRPARLLPDRRQSPRRHAVRDHANSTKPSHDVTIADNLIWRGAGDNAQGIWISDDLGGMPSSGSRSAATW
jgi:hypothetical protein